MYDRRYYLAHREEILARAKKWREENPDRYQRIRQRCFKRNKDKYTAQQKLYRYENHDKIEQQQKVYYALNRDVILEKLKEYRKKNADKIFRQRQRFRELKKYSNIDGWCVYYENQGTRFHWKAKKGTFKFHDDKEQGFPSLFSAYKNALKCLGDTFSRDRQKK